jgi:hypothetical protein
MIYGFYLKYDPKQEIINKIIAFSRLSAAEVFAKRKCLDLKSFLEIYGVKRIN